MKKIHSFFLLLLSFTALTGCGRTGQKTAEISVVYLVFSILALAILALYFRLLKKIDPWHIILLSSVVVVNTGYYILSVSTTLSTALWANRISYLGSVFLPLSILMAILNATKTRKPKWLPATLIALSCVVFLITATPGVLDIYYKEVSLGSYNGATVLEKVYGPFHTAYLFYLLTYTAVTVCVAVRVAVKKKLSTKLQTFVLVASAFLNIIVWLLEQFVHIDFELLSVSYVITEVFLLCLFFMMQEEEKYTSSTLCVTVPASPQKEVQRISAEDEKDTLVLYTEGLSRLTPTEHTIYNYYLDGKTTKEIMATLNITENTLKYHNKNIYSKLGVSSRKQLLYFAVLKKDLQKCKK